MLEISPFFHISIYTHTHIWFKGFQSVDIMKTKQKCKLVHFKELFILILPFHKTLEKMLSVTLHFFLQVCIFLRFISDNVPFDPSPNPTKIQLSSCLTCYCFALHDFFLSLWMLLGSSSKSSKLLFTYSLRLLSFLILGIFII